MKKLISLFFCITTISLLSAQYLQKPLRNDLSLVPELKVTILDSSFLEQKICLGFTTDDMHPLLGKKPNYGTSFQITSISEPYPPKVFGSFDKNPNFKGRTFTDFRIHPNGLQSLYLISSSDSNPGIQAYIIFKKEMDGRYTVTDTFYGNGHHLDGHSFVIDENGYYWFTSNYFHPYNMSRLTGRPKDTAAIVKTTGVVIWDPTTKTTVFKMDLWDRGFVPIEDIRIDLMSNGRGGDVDARIPLYDATHPNSWYPVGSVDGCSVGALSDLFDGIKFIRLCDSSVLRYGATQSDFTPLDSANHLLHQQHDFKKISKGKYAGYYTCFNNGDDSVFIQPSRVPILDFNLSLRTVKMIAEVEFTDIFSVFRGNVDFLGNYMLVNFGGSEQQILGGPNWVVYDWQKEKIVAEYRLPAVNFAYTVWFINDEFTIPEVNFTTPERMTIDSTLWKDPLWANGSSTYSINASPDRDQYLTVNAGEIFRLACSPKSRAMKKRKRSITMNNPSKSKIFIAHT